MGNIGTGKIRRIPKNLNDDDDKKFIIPCIK